MPMVSSSALRRSVTLRPLRLPTRPTWSGSFGSSWPPTEDASLFPTWPTCMSAARCDGDEQAAVLVVRGEEVRNDVLPLAGPCPQLELLAEAPHAPFERELGGILLSLEAAECEPFDEVGAEQLLFAVPDELEDASPGGEDPSFLVAD